MFLKMFRREKESDIDLEANKRMAENTYKELMMMVNAELEKIPQQPNYDLGRELDMQQARDSIKVVIIKLH